MKCKNLERTLASDHRAVVVLGNKYSDLLAGRLVLHKELLDGELVGAPVAGGKATLRVDLPVSEPIVRVDEAGVESLSVAWSKLVQRINDHYQADALPARVNSVVQVANSYEHALEQSGISVRYSNPFITGGIGKAFETQEARRERTIVVRLTQAAYTISLVDDANDFFDTILTSPVSGNESVLALDDEELAYVKSVTYGRVYLFTLRNEEFNTSEELKEWFKVSLTAIEQKGEVAAEKLKKYQNVTSNSQIEVVAWGGSDKVALEAIKTGDFRKALEPMRADEALPLAFSARYLRAAADQRDEVVFRDVTKYYDRYCCAASCPHPGWDTAQDWYKIVENNGDLFGFSKDLVHGNKKCTGASQGWIRSHVHLDKTAGKGTCTKLGWVTSDKKNCQYKVHYGAGSTEGVHCAVTIYRKREKKAASPECGGGAAAKCKADDALEEEAFRYILRPQDAEAGKANPREEFVDLPRPWAESKKEDPK